MLHISQTSQLRQIHGQEISWVGLSPWTGKMCYGTESGALVFAPPNGDIDGNGSRAVNILEDPINAVAFSGEYIAATSRNSISLGRRIRDGFVLSQAFGDFGAHQVVARPRGGFIATLGTDGILLINPKGEDLEGLTVGFEDRANFYRIATLASRGNAEVFACAARGSGFLGLSIRGGSLETSVTDHVRPEIDVIDVCSISSSDAPLAAAGLDRDGTIYLAKDVRDRVHPQSVKITGLTGTPYTILCLKGNIFVFTSLGMLIVPNLVHDFLAGKPIAEEASLPFMPIRGAEAFIANDELLFLVDGKVLSFDLSNISEQIRIYSGSANSFLGTPQSYASGVTQGGSHPLSTSASDWQPPTIRPLRTSYHSPVVVSHDDWQTAPLHPYSVA
jgi:hypothetical protein